MTAEPALPPPPEAVKGFRTLLEDSLDASMTNLRACVPLVLTAVVPGAVLLCLAIAAAGGVVPDEEYVKAAVRVGRYREFALLMAGSLADKAFSAWVFTAMVLAFGGEGGFPGYAEALSEAGRRLPRLAWVAVIAAVRIIGGLILFVVPGVIFSLRYSQSHLSCLLEGKAGTAALSRSSALFAAHPGRIWLSLLTMSFIVFVAGFIASFPVRLLAAFAPDLVWLNVLFNLAITVIQNLTGVWAVAFTVFLYKDLARLHPETA